MVEKKDAEKPPAEQPIRWTSAWIARLYDAAIILRGVAGLFVWIGLMWFLRGAMPRGPIGNSVFTALIIPGLLYALRMTEQDLR